MLAVLPLLGAMLAHVAQPGERIDQCRPIPEAASTAAALNRFWRRDIALCESDDPEDSAVAVTDADLVLANRDWLRWIAEDYGPSAAVGILAHEWAHMAYPEGEGRIAELQADCLAGAFLRRAGYDQRALAPFALVSLHSGDGRRSWKGGHGTGQERRSAVLRGYGASGRDRGALASFCQNNLS